MPFGGNKFSLGKDKTLGLRAWISVCSKSPYKVTFKQYLFVYLAALGLCCIIRDFSLLWCMTLNCGAWT